MTNDSPSMRLEQAIHNNADWCDLVSRSHGIPGEFQAEIWLNHNRVPPLYPNAVTLTGFSGIAAQMRAIQTLAGDSALPDLSVKDSFHTLDLTPFGFQVLF